MSLLTAPCPAPIRPGHPSPALPLLATLSLCLLGACARGGAEAGDPARQALGGVSTVEAVPSAEPRVEVAGRFVYLRDFGSAILGNRRDIRVYLPRGYGDGEGAYPVLYMHDGQNLFDAAQSFSGEWGVDETVDRLTASGAIPPIVVVGIDNGGGRRLLEYTPTVDPEEEGGGGDSYISFVSQELMPYVEANFRVKTGPEHTAVMGSSLGGLISCHMGLTHPETFGLVGCLSPSLWWDETAAIAAVEAPGAMLRARFWVDGGSAEGEDDDGDGLTYVIEHTRRYRDGLLARGLTWGEGVGYLEALGAPHNEGAWAARLEQPLLFFYGERASRTPEALEVVLYREPLGLGAEGSGELAVQLKASDGLTLTLPNNAVTLTSGDPAVVTVGADGALSPVAEGFVRIEAAYGGLNASEGIHVSGDAEAFVTLRLEVDVPGGAAEGEGIFVAGNAAELGGWDPGAVAMAPVPGTDRYAVVLSLRRGAHLAYKFTRGTWDAVEKGAGCEERGDRSLHVTESGAHRDRVEAWADRPPCGG